MLLILLLLLALPACRNEPDGRTPMSEPIPLPAPRLRGTVSVEEALRARRSVRDYRPSPLSLDQIGQLLWAAQGLTDTVRGFRTAPSAGALYPLELRVLAARVTGLSPGLYRYVPAGHRIVMERAGEMHEELAAAALGQEPVRRAPAVILLSAVAARTAAKYGDRAERYVMMEAGHSSENVYLQAVSLGLGTVAIGAFHDDRARSVLHLPGGERLLYIMPVGMPAENAND